MDHCIYFTGRNFLTVFHSGIQIIQTTSSDPSLPSPNPKKVKFKKHPTERLLLGFLDQ